MIGESILNLLIYHSLRLVLTALLGAATEGIPSEGVLFLYSVV